MNKGSQGIVKQESKTLKSYFSLVNLCSHGADRGCYVVIESQVEGTHLKLTGFVVGCTNEVAVHRFHQVLYARNEAQQFSHIDCAIHGEHRFKPSFCVPRGFHNMGQPCTFLQLADSALQMAQLGVQGFYLSCLRLVLC